MEASKLPLEGVTIADFSWVLAGPRATEFLGAMGARIIKIEGPYRPDQFRGTPGGAPIPDTDPEKYSATFWSLNYSKLGCTVDITQPKGRELALEIVKQSDVVIENYAYGVMEKAHLSYADLCEVKPDIIMVSGSAVGKTGPSKGYVAYGQMLHAFSGVNTVTGYEGEKSGTISGTWTDPITGATLVLAVLSAVWYKQRTGKGQWIDCSMGETTINQIPDLFLDYTVNGRVTKPYGNQDQHGAPHDSYPCREDGKWLAITVRNQQEWESFCTAINSPGWTLDSRFADQYKRWKNRHVLDGFVKGWTKTQHATDAMHLLQRAGVPAAVCHNNKGIYEDPHLNARGFLVELEQEIVGRKPVVRLPWLLNPGPNGRYFPAPLLGQHNDLVFREMLGLSDDAIEDLRASKVIL